MPRPFKRRQVADTPAVTAFKPAGVAGRRLDTVTLGQDELEAIRLADGEGLYFDEAGRRMGVSRATFGRVIESARRKVADALVNGKMLIVRGGPVATPVARGFYCNTCGWEFEGAFGTGRPDECPKCGSVDIRRAGAHGGRTGGAIGAGSGWGRGGGRRRRRFRGGGVGSGEPVAPAGSADDAARLSADGGEEEA